jgi:RNA-binding protein with serine-rich domain 1
MNNGQTNSTTNIKNQMIIMVLYNITRNVTSKHIEEIFSAYGKVFGVYIPKDEKTRLNKNYAFIEYENINQAEKASLYMDGGQIDGEYVRTEILNPKNYIRQPSTSTS